MTDFNHIIRAAVQEALEPQVKRIETKLAQVENRIDDFVPRRTLTKTTKLRHIGAIKALGGRCPC